MKNTFLRYFRCLIVLSAAFGLNAEAALSAFANEPSVRLPGHMPDLPAAKSSFVENLDPTQDLSMTFVLPLRNQDELEKLVQRLYDPADQDYFGKYLSTEEFIDRFAPTQEDYDKVIAYAEELGLIVSNTHANRTLLSAAGPAKAIEKGFNLGLREYKIDTGRIIYAPDNNPEVPVSIAKIINGVVGLDNLAVWHSYHQLKKQSTKPTAKAASSYPSGPGGGYAPSDIAIAYNLTGVSANGSGQTIALFQLASYQASDIITYTNYFGLPAPKLTNILVDGGSGTGIDAEVTLDIELALALAPQSKIYVYEGPNTNQGVLDTYNRIATDNLAKQVSSSWGIGEGLVSSQYLQAENAIFLQMAAHGQTIYAAAGDSGAYDNYPSFTLMVDDPASQPYVVGVGGTTLAVNPTTGIYASEKVWNEGFGYGAGGGGVSKFWPIPSWQANVPTVYSKTNRNVPDISLNSDPGTGYSIFYDGQWQIYGGTSCAAPLWASFTSLVNQELAAGQKPFLGFANPTFYAIGGRASPAPEYHDIITGNNQYYSASTGFDDATGWGSFNGLNLFTTLTNPQSGTQPPPPPQTSPALNITMTHVSPFVRWGYGSYHIGVSNQGKASTAGDVQVAVKLPAGLTYYTHLTSGWSFNKNTLTFTNKNILKPGASYPSIVLYVKVSSTAPASLSPSATVSGGGSPSRTVTDFTTTR